MVLADVDLTGQVTYPYIMAKVRLQARPAAEVDEEKDLQTTIIEGSSFINIQEESVAVPVPIKPRYDGAIDLLKKTLAEKGFAGWYQVCSVDSSLTSN